MAGRKLASVQYVHEVAPIEGADRIELVRVLGWQCVAKKGEFKVGDLAVYFEIDSFLPIAPQFEFLRPGSYKNSDLLGEGFRLKTQKFRGQISQGLVLPLSILPPGDWRIGQCVAQELGVRKWEISERATSGDTIIADFPREVPKTEETRAQSAPELINEFAGVSYYISTKMDGTSVTMARIDGRFRVCGHNYEYAEDGKCDFWSYARENKIEERLAEHGFDNLALQGEFCAAGIQENPLRLVRPSWYVFTVYDIEHRRRLGMEEMRKVCDGLELEMAPIEEVGEELPYKTVGELLSRAKGNYASGVRKEGVVVRPQEPRYSPTIQGPLSMKVINNDYLLREK